MVSCGSGKYKFKPLKSQKRLGKSTFNLSKAVIVTRPWADYLAKIISIPFRPLHQLLSGLVGHAYHVASEYAPRLFGKNEEEQITQLIQEEEEATFQVCVKAITKRDDTVQRNEEKITLCRGSLVSHVNRLPFDVIATVSSFLTPSETSSLKAVSRLFRPQIDKYATIRLNIFTNNNPIYVGDITNRTLYKGPDSGTSFNIPVLSFIRYLSLHFMCDCSVASIQFIFISESFSFFHLQRLFQSVLEHQEVLDNSNYLLKHAPAALGHFRFIDENMRSCVTDWLAEVAVEYDINGVILHRSVLRLDRYLSRNVISRGSFQLIGCCCLFIESTIAGMN